MVAPVVLVAVGGACGAVLRWSVLSREQALALGTGLLGAFTTMSTFAVEVLRLVDGGERYLAVGYVLTTLVGCPALAWCGWSMAEALTA